MKFHFPTLSKMQAKNIMTEKVYDFYRDMIVERMIDEKKKKDNLNEEEIKVKLREIIRNPKGKYISQPPYSGY